VSFAALGFALIVVFGTLNPSLAARPVTGVRYFTNGGDRIALDASREIVERAADAQAMLDVLNAERAGKGLEPLAFDPRLCAIARSHAVDMAVRSYFGHVTPEGAGPFDRLNRAHYRYGFAGENLALDANVSSASSELWSSSEHRSNILQPRFARVGIAAVRATDGEIFVEDFSD
jgi:uncharacterized protein YkwD